MPQSTQCHTLYDRIVNHLIINAGFIDNPGLYHGKMGIVLFFVHYARYTGNSIYEEYAGDLMDDIYRSITNRISWNFETGLAGIGWGIHYLLKNGFMEGDPDEVLEVIDQKMLEVNLPNLRNVSLESGLQGIICYLETRIDAKKDNPRSSFNERYRKDYFSIKDRFQSMTSQDILLSIVGTLPSGDVITDWQLGLHQGCAGYAIKWLINTERTD